MRETEDDTRLTRQGAQRAGDEADGRRDQEHDHDRRHDHHHDHHRHMVEDFRRRFWVSLAVTAPILVLSPMLQAWLGLSDRISFPGDTYVLLGLSSFIYAYGGWPFLTGLVDELREDPRRWRGRRRAQQHKREHAYGREHTRRDQRADVAGGLICRMAWRIDPERIHSAMNAYARADTLLQNRWVGLRRRGVSG